MTASAKIAAMAVANFLAAAEANRSCSTRRANVVHLTSKSAEELMVTGDLHGQRLHFHKLLRIADLSNRSGRHLMMQEVCHGGPTYPTEGGGCMSHLMLEDVARLKVEYPDRFHFLLSNHELAELTDYPIIKGRRMLNLMFRAGLERMYGDCAEDVRQAAQAFIGSCPLAIRVEGGVFLTHSLPEQTDLGGFDVSVFDRPLETADVTDRGPAFRLVWGRDYRAANARAFARLVRAEVLVTGHEPCPEGFQAPNDWQVIIDCCGRRACYLTLPVGRRLSHAQVKQKVKAL